MSDIYTNIFINIYLVLRLQRKNKVVDDILYCSHIHKYSFFLYMTFTDFGYILKK